MRSKFDGEERSGAVIAIQDMCSIFLNQTGNKLLSLTLVNHLRDVHGYTAEEAVKEIVSIEGEALRAVADSLEERTVEFLHSVKTT